MTLRWDLKSILLENTMCHKSALGGDRAANGFLNVAVSTLVTLLIISLCTTGLLRRKNVFLTFRWERKQHLDQTTIHIHFQISQICLQVSLLKNSTNLMINFLDSRLLIFCNHLYLHVQDVQLVDTFNTSSFLPVTETVSIAPRFNNHCIFFPEDLIVTSTSQLL